MVTLHPQDVLAVRERLNLSRQVFARYLRTLENWEQGRAKPNAHGQRCSPLQCRFCASAHWRAPSP